MFQNHHLKAVLNPVAKCTTLCLLLAGFLIAVSGTAYAQEVGTMISSREAWVGSPIVLQLQVRNAKKYSLPDDFKIDGCDVRSAGNPSQSSRIMIINGRRSENRSVTQQYLITPRREGKFEIPALDVEVDGELKQTDAISFVATQSETGDLLFVEVEGKKDAVFVGEQLDLKLKIWIKPFADRENKIKLTESHMWQMLSNENSWGAFRDRLQELINNRQRPRGKSVLRKDDDGRGREYYLYEIEGTVYPTKPGMIDASDLQIVVNYPVSLGARNDPFGSIFGSSPFGRRLVVTDSRPVSAEAKVNSTKVLPVPTTNQPNDYRGAVGRYQIVAEAQPKSVTAGDPITLTLGITGDGPMELVQAPPLHDIESLAADFQVTDQSLAGFVQDESKFFVTTIRPRSESVTQIPAIPFSFFDPNKKAYETVYSKPIDINVEKAEAFQLDSIVSNSAQINKLVDGNQQVPDNATTTRLDLQNNFSEDVLLEESPASKSGWMYYAIVPAMCWLLLVVGKLVFSLLALLDKFKSPVARATNAVAGAGSGQELAAALRDYVAEATKCPCHTDESAVGQIREIGDYQTANSLESLFHQIRRIDQPGVSLTDAQPQVSIDQLKSDCHQMISNIQQSSRERRRIRDSNPHSKKRNLTTTSLILVLSSLTLAHADADESTSRLPLLAEANRAYQSASEIDVSNPAQSRDKFGDAANLYQQLVDQGVRNSDLFFNLANAWHQSGEPALAIVNYHRALWLNPAMQKARHNLDLLKEQQTAAGMASGQDDMPLLSLDGLKWLLSTGFNWIGWNMAVAIFAIASIIFWGLVCWKTIKPNTRAIRWAVVPFCIMGVCGLALFGNGASQADLAIVTSDAIELRSGDGDEFPVQAKIESSSGTAVIVTEERQRWFRIELPTGKSGWVPGKYLERVAM